MSDERATQTAGYRAVSEAVRIAESKSGLIREVMASRAKDKLEAKIAQVRLRLAGMVALGNQKTDEEMYELAVGLWQTARLALQELDA